MTWAGSSGAARRQSGTQADDSYAREALEVSIIGQHRVDAVFTTQGDDNGVGNQTAAHLAFSENRLE